MGELTVVTVAGLLDSSWNVVSSLSGWISSKVLLSDVNFAVGKSKSELYLAVSLMR